MSAYNTLAIVGLAVAAISVAILKLDELFAKHDRRPPERELVAAAPRRSNTASEFDTASTRRRHPATLSRPSGLRTARAPSPVRARSGPAAARGRRIPIPPLAG